MEEITKMSTSDIQKKIRNMYILKRDLYRNISECKIALKTADDIIDACEKELRERGHI